MIPYGYMESCIGLTIICCNGKRFNVVSAYLKNRQRFLAMANIEKRIARNGQATFRVKVRLKGAPVQSATFEKLKGAKDWAQQTETAIREGRYFKMKEAEHN